MEPLGWYNLDRDVEFDILQGDRDPQTCPIPVLELTRAELAAFSSIARVVLTSASKLDSLEQVFNGRQVQSVRAKLQAHVKSLQRHEATRDIVWLRSSQLGCAKELQECVEFCEDASLHFFEAADNPILRAELTAIFFEVFKQLQNELDNNTDKVMSRLKNLRQEFKGRNL
jgi:hypothetical protein